MTSAFNISPAPLRLVKPEPHWKEPSNLKLLAAALSVVAQIETPADNYRNWSASK